LSHPKNYWILITNFKLHLKKGVFLVSSEYFRPKSLPFANLSSILSYYYA
jgi:hypothetical protein